MTNQPPPWDQGSTQPGYGQYPQQQGNYPPPYSQQPYPPQPGPVQPPGGRRSWVRRHKVLTSLGAVAAVIVVSVIAAGGKHPAPAAAPAAATSAPPAAVATSAAARSSAPAAAPKITYLVTGTPGAADVTYGPEGSNLTGKVPMRVTKRLGSAGFYSIQAQLQGGGHVKVEILVNGKVISSGTAEGGYNIASAEISQDPITGKWEDTQG